MGLSLAETKAIETEVLKPYDTRKNNLQEYEQAYLEAIRPGHSISEHTRNELKDLQQLLGLRDEDLAPIQATIIAEQQRSTAGNPTPHSSRKKNFLLFMGLFIGAVSCFGAGVWFSHKPTQPPTTIAASCQNNAQAETGLKISLGEKILLQGDTNSDKQAGIQAFAKNDFQTAIDKFKSYRQNCGNDPEALIYLNNAQAAKKGNPLKIAVSVPIGSNPNVAKEILRGVAQAQDEVNQNGGINGKLLQIAIANDDNDPRSASQIADQFVKDVNILAVVGHNASNTSFAAAPVYQQGGLVMVAPTGFAQSLSSMHGQLYIPHCSQD